MREPFFNNSLATCLPVVCRDVEIKEKSGNKVWRTSQNSIFNDDIIKVAGSSAGFEVYKENYGRKPVDLQQTSTSFAHQQSLTHIKNK